MCVHSTRPVTLVPYSPSKWLRNSLVTDHNDDEGHRICMVITLIVVEASKAWSGWHGDNPITRSTSTANTFSRNCGATHWYATNTLTVLKGDASFEPWCVQFGNIMMINKSINTITSRPFHLSIVQLLPNSSSFARVIFYIYSPWGNISPNYFSNQCLQVLYNVRCLIYIWKSNYFLRIIVAKYMTFLTGTKKEIEIFQCNALQCRVQQL